MALSLKPLDQQTIVITGASSGIGLSTALMAAERGVNLVLVARSPENLEDVAEQCRAKGAEVETVVADVADAAVLKLVAERATERFGGFDTWVNNAGASVYGRLWDIPEEDARQVFETNYWGSVHGSLVAANHFRERSGDDTDSEYGGALINVGSVLSDRAIPLQGHYCATKHAIKGFTDALRMELEKDDVPVSVTLIKPSAIDTPYPEHAANYMDEEPALPQPSYDPNVVARAILRAAERPLRDVTVGAKDGVMAALGAAAPRLTDKIMESAFFGQQQGGPATGDRRGTLHEPKAGSASRTGSGGPVFEHSLWTQMQTRPLVALGAAAAAGAALVWTLGKSN